MKQKHFYSELVSIEEITVELDKLKLDKEEKEELEGIANATIHYEIINIALTPLNEEDKKKFLEHAKNEEHKEAMDFLKSKAENIEQQIKEKVEQVKKELLKDIKELTS